jgi:hypothetical protein
VVGVQIVPKKCLCDRIEKDGWDGHQGSKFVKCSVYLSGGETQPTHNNQKIRQLMAGLQDAKKASGGEHSEREGADNTSIGLATTSRLCQSNTQQSNRKAGGGRTTR